MTRDRHSRTIRAPASAALCLVGLLASGCSGGSGLSGAGNAGHAPVGGEWALEDTKAAIALLNAGRPDAAREKLLRALKARPGDMIAQSLLKQIDTDPRVLLGARNHGYVVKEGDTMSGLAQRFLGDPLMSYALARYNGLTSPLSIAPGKSLRIPGQAKAPAAARKNSGEPAKSAGPAASPAAKPVRTATSPAEAARLRGQGLAAMNSGAINRAVTLLRQALARDPENGVIRNDLARALRIQGTLNGRP